MPEGAARHLLRAGADEIFITNRTPERAQEVADLFRGEVLPYETFPQRLCEMDIVITSSAAPGFVLGRDAVRRAIESRKSQPMFLIDIAVPRNIDPAVNGLEHAFLYDIDDLQRLTDRNLRARQEVAQQAEIESNAFFGCYYPDHRIARITTRTLAGPLRRRFARAVRHFHSYRNHKDNR
jgi:glutamyl-tRNA reductase